MADGFSWKELTPGQQQTYQTTMAVYQAYLQARRDSRPLKGGMHWKTIRGREYLYRYRDRLGHGESLGPRAADTEQLFASYTRERREVTARLHRERQRLTEQARFCRAARLNRVPPATARILRRLEEDPAGRNFLVIGTSALYAYEAAAGVLLDSAIPEDLLAPSRGRLTLAVAGMMSWEEFLPLLNRTDRSFVPDPEVECRAVNREGFQVQLLKAGSRRPGKQKTLTVPGAREPLPPEAGNLQYLTASPKFTQMVIGQDGGPATMMVADPRAFALNKLWLSQQEDREEAKRRCEYRQALAVADLVLRYLPPYDYFSTELDMLPQDLVQSAARFAEGQEPEGEEDGIHSPYE
ncbi:MAG: GSU2403 family nucleotidyltransferase fold protein [Syntrophales bacterium]|nr:GSU2403 family nucleotidyltransferase fold protein [Syntrophales bacterium]